MKRLLKSFLGNTPLFMSTVFLWATAHMLMDFLVRLIRKNDVALSYSQTREILLANLHWVLSLTILITLAYGLAIPAAVKDLSDPITRKRHTRTWLGSAFLLCPFYFLHINFVLPESNHQAYRLRQSIIHEGDTTHMRTQRTNRELSIGQMLDSLKAIPAEIQAIHESNQNPKLKVRRLETFQAWESKLRWEIDKKIQMTMLLPITAAMALAVGVFLQRSRRSYARFLLAGIMAKAFMTFIFWVMIRIEKTIDASGYSYTKAWLPFTAIALAAAASAYPILKPWRLHTSLSSPRPVE